MADQIATLNTDHPVDEVHDEDGNFCFTANGEAVHQIGHQQCSNKDLLDKQLADVKQQPWSNATLLDKFKDLVEAHPSYKN